MGKVKLFVQAGPNGVGKSISYPVYIPEGIPYINTDEISKRLKLQHPTLPNTSELANARAIEIMNRYILKKESYSFETNLHDKETWKFIEQHRFLGYEVLINFYTADSVDLLNERIKLRVKNGGHFIRPDVVQQRFESAMRLLAYYYQIPDVLTIIDTTELDHRPIMKFEQGRLVFQSSEMPQHFEVFKGILQKGRKKKTADLSIEEVRKKYRSR